MQVFGIGDTFSTAISLSAILLHVSIGTENTIFDGIAINYCHTFEEYREQPWSSHTCGTATGNELSPMVTIRDLGVISLHPLM